MKKFLIFSFISFFSNCQPFPEAKMFSGTFILRNDSKTELKLIIADRVLDNLNETTLSIGESFIGNEAEVTNEDSFQNPSSIISAISLGGDTIVMVFNNERKIGYSYNYNNGNVIFDAPTERNPYKFNNYTNIGNDEYLFTITQEDFDNATPCDGPCL